MRAQCRCGKICRSKSSLKTHILIASADGTIHELNTVVKRFKNAGPNRVDERKEQERNEADGVRRFTA